MNYSADNFVALMEAVEAQGGAHAPDRCVPYEYALSMPSPTRKGGRENRTFKTTGCKQAARFTIIYDVRAAVSIPSAKDPSVMVTMRPGPKEAKQMLERGAGFLTACAVDDNMGAWPRFRGSQEEQS